MTTIKDVARRAGVGVGTASRVLSGNGSSSAAAKAAVETAAQELRFVANGSARALRRARTDVLGLLISDIRNPFFADLAHGAEQEALEAGYTILLANVDEDPVQEQRYLTAFASQRVDGMLIAPQGHDSRALKELVESERPLVFVDRTLDGLEVPSVTSDNAGGVRSAVAHLMAKGHRSIAYISGPSTVSSSTERLVAFRAACVDAGIDLDDRLIAEGDYRASSGQVALASILDSGLAPTALLTADGLMTLGALDELQRRGGPRLEMVSFDDAPWFAHVRPPVSAVVNDADEIGRRGVRTLLDLIEGEVGQSSRVPTRFIARGAVS